MTRGACPCREQTSASEPSTYWLHRAWKSCKKRSFSTFPPCLLLLLGKRGFSWLPSVTNHSEREQRENRIPGIWWGAHPDYIAVLGINFRAPLDHLVHLSTIMPSLPGRLIADASAAQARKGWTTGAANAAADAVLRKTRRVVMHSPLRNETLLY